MKFGIFLMISLLLISCAVGPNYHKPKVLVPFKYKEAPKGWKYAKPHDQCAKGAWWEIFNDPELNNLEKKLHITNQNIQEAAANYQQSLALVSEARAAFFPTLAATADLTRQKQGSGSTTFVSTSGSSVSEDTASTGSNHGNGKITTTHTLALNASWEVDVWGSVRRNVESNVANAQSSFAELISAELSAEASLAQYYFQLKALDRDQKILDETVLAYKKSLTLTQNRYNMGVAAKSDVIQAETQLQTAEAEAIANRIPRAQTEHAIAILLGIPPALFSLPFKPLYANPPYIPVEVPSTLLERRPDIASAERQMAAANAQIGVAIAAFFPTLNLSASGSYTHEGFSRWISLPNASWSLAADLAQTLFDGGLRRAAVKAAKAAYYANIAIYRQTVLNAFQEVEDNLASIRLLKKQRIVETEAMKNAKKSAALILNQYKSGIVDYTAVITAQNIAYSAEKTAADIEGQEMVAAVLLIKALGGGWNTCTMCGAGTPALELF